MTGMVPNRNFGSPLPTCSPIGGVSPRSFFIYLKNAFSYCYLTYILAVPANLVGDVDFDIIKRTRDVLTDITMTEILNEDPQGPTAFRDAVRQQIVALCTRLRVSLVIVDKLMLVANNLSKDTN
jgi:hypothetical protein